MTVPGLPGLPRLDVAAFAYPAAEIRKLAEIRKPADRYAAALDSGPVRAMLAANAAAIRLFPAATSGANRSAP
jgi:hypothetical protein